MQHALSSEFINGINNRLREERAPGAHRPSYLDKYSRLHYNDALLALASIARRFNDGPLLEAVSHTQELRERTEFQVDALRIAASVDGHTPRPNFFIGVEHCYDWALQGYNNAFPNHEPVFLYQKLILERKNKTATAYVLAKYPSYPHIEIEKIIVERNPRAGQEQQPAMGAEIHGAAAALGISLQLCPEIEASIIRIRGLEHIVREVNDRTTHQAWSHWRYNMLEPWLDAIVQQQGRVDPNPAPRGPNADIPDNTPSLAVQVRDFLTAWDRKNPIRAFREREPLLRNSSWAQQRALFNPIDAFNPFYLLESMRLLAFVVAYAQSPHFRSFPQEAQYLFYQQFFYSLTQGLAHCNAGVFDRAMMLVRDTMFSMHREHVEQSFHGGQNLVDDMVSFLLKTDPSDVSQQTLVPSSVLKTLFMRTMKICQSSAQTNTVFPWRTVFEQQQQYVLANPQVFERNRERLERSVAAEFAQISSYTASLQTVTALSPDIFLSQQEVELLAQLPLTCHHLLENSQLADQSERLILQQCERLPDYHRVISQQARERLPVIIRKKIRLAQIRDVLEERLVAQHPARALPEAAGMAERFRNLLADQTRVTQENAAVLFAQISQCALIMRDRALITESMQLRGRFFQKLQELANQEITLEQLRREACVNGTAALVETLSAARPDRSFERPLQALLAGQPIETDSILGGVIHTQYRHAPEVFGETQVTYFSQEQLPDADALPSVHDFLRVASQLSGLSAPYLRLVLAILGRQKKELLTHSREDDPFEGEIRPIHRGLKILADNYRSIIQAGSRGHSGLLSDRTFIQELLSYHSICAQNYQAAEQEHKNQIAPYYAHIQQRQAGFNFSLTNIVQRSCDAPQQLVRLLERGEVDLVEEIFTRTTPALLVDRASAITAFRKILMWMHEHQHYRLFHCLLDLSKSLNIKSEVFDADLLCKVLSFSKVRQLLPALTTLQREEALIKETAVLLSRIDMTASYIRALLCHWEDFSYIFDAQRLQQTLQSDDMEEIKNMIEGLEFHFLKNGFVVEDPLGAARKANFIFIYRMIQHAIRHQNPYVATHLFNIFIAPVWQQASGETILNERLASLIIALQCHGNNDDRDMFIRHVGQWCQRTERFTAASRLDLNSVAPDHFQRPFSVADIDYFAFVAEALNIRVIVLPTQLRTRFSIEVIQRMEAYRHRAHGPQVKFFYSIYGRVSFRDFIKLVVDSIKKAVRFLFHKVFGPARQPEPAAVEPRELGEQGPLPVPQDTRSISEIYRSHRCLRFSARLGQERPAQAQHPRR